MAIERVSIEGGTPELIAASLIPETLNDYGFSISPDGKLLAFNFTRTNTLKTQIALVNPDEKIGRSPSHFLDTDQRLSMHPEFTPDGKALVYAIKENGVENLWFQPLNGTPGRAISNFANDRFVTYQYSPDGKSLGLLRVHTDSDVVLLRDRKSYD